MVDNDDNDVKKRSDDEDLDEASDGNGHAASDARKSDADEDEDEAHDASEDETVALGVRAPSSHAPRAGAVERAASRAAVAHDHGLSHITPVKLLLGVFGALTVLTVFTVLVTSIDLGSQGNFVVAMIIATIKAGLVMAFFMHLVWDKKFNLTVFLSAFLFVLLFLSLAMTDRNEYQAQIDTFEQNNPLTIQPTHAAPASPAAPAAPAH